MNPSTINWRALGARVGLLLLVVLGTGVLLGTLFLPTAFAVGGMIDSVKATVFDVPPLAAAPPVPERSVIYSADGSELETIFFEENRSIVALAEIPLTTQNAVLATEDADFWTHNGVNIKAIARAAISNAAAGSVQSGGSTITQQYVKGVYLTNDQTLNRKIKEALYAVELEKVLSKSEILEGYLNRTYFGDGIYGIATAGEYYFSTGVQDLSLAQSATLAGVIRLPEKNNPVDSPENALARRNIVLDQMASHGFVSRDQADAAKAEPLGLNVSQLAKAESPFFVDWVKGLLVNEDVAVALGSQTEVLDVLGVDTEARRASVFQGGLRIHTTLDPEFQQLALASLHQYLTDALRDPMGAIVSVEPGTGAVKAMAVGPKTFGTCPEPVEVAEDGEILCDKIKFNPAVPGRGGSGRQPGSSFKPFVIAAALEAGFPPGWEVNATGPYTFPAGKCQQGSYTVNNSGGNGFLDMYSGVKASSNVFHTRLISELGPAKAADMAYRLGIRSSPIEGPGCALALGATEVTPLEMATAYASLANRGEYCAPFAITRIEDRDGKVLYQHTPKCEQVLDAKIADRVIDIMSGPVTSGGTAPIANLGRWPTRGKTGTTNDYVDAWFVGYIKQLATAAWMGYDNGTKSYLQSDGTITTRSVRKLMQNVVISGQRYARIFGGTISAPMWKTYMAEAAKRFDPEGWPSPGSQGATTVPDVSGMTPAEAEAAAKARKLNFELVRVGHFAPDGTFVGQAPAAGATATVGTALQYHVSNGALQLPTVPAVWHLAEAVAVQVLADAGYATRVVYRDIGDPELDGLVLAQSPAAGAQQAPGPDSIVVIQVGRYVADQGDPCKGLKGQEKKECEDGPGPQPSPSPSPDPSPASGSEGTTGGQAPPAAG